MPIIIIVEFGQQRQLIKLKQFFYTINELLDLFSQTFHVALNLKKYDILLFNKRLDSTTKLDFTQLDKYQRFKIQLNNDENEMTSLKRRLNTASIEIMEVNFLISSILQNYNNLIKTLSDEDLTVPPGFKPLSNRRLVTKEKQLNTSPRDSQSTDEGIDRDTGSVSIFESARSDHDYESVYLECREDVTIINEPNSMMINKLEWRNQPCRPRPPLWNSNKVKSQYSDKPRLKKIVNPNKAPLPQDKKKNIPCKYAAGGNCKRGKISNMMLSIIFIFQI